MAWVKTFQVLIAAKSGLRLAQVLQFRAWFLAISYFGFFIMLMTAFVAKASAQSAENPQFCNVGTEPLYLALALEKDAELLSFGWFQIAQGACESPLNETLSQEGLAPYQGETLYLHAKNHLNRPSWTLGQGLSLCVDTVFESFWADFADSTCAKRGYDRAEFSVLSPLHGLVHIGPSGILEPEAQ